MLYKQDDFEEIVFSEYVDKLKLLILSMHTVKRDINIQVIGKGNIALPLNTMIQFGLIINEMLTNSLKYAKNSKGIKILISLEKIDDEFIFIYRDNGEEELSEDSLKESSGLGIRLIGLSVKQLDGEFRKYYDNGLCYEVKFGRT